MIRPTALLTTLLLLSCGSATETPPPPPEVDAGTQADADAGAEQPDAGTTHTEPVATRARALILQGCGSVYCHGPTFPDDVKTMRSPNAGMDLVVAFAPEQSYLWHKVAGTHATLHACTSGRCGGRMPPTAPLTDAELDLVRAWIAAGAE